MGIRWVHCPRRLRLALLTLLLTNEDAITGWNRAGWMAQPGLGDRIRAFVGPNRVMVLGDVVERCIRRWRCHCLVLSQGDLTDGNGRQYLYG
jgi:hypothetical protein